MANARTRARNILSALPLSTRQRDLYERGVAAMDDATLERTTSKLESALSRAPEVLAAAQELLASQQAQSRKSAAVFVEDEESNPTPSHSSTEPRGQAHIGRAVTIKGQIFSREDLTIDGEIDGSVELHGHRLTVGPTGRLRARVKARDVVVLGTIHGNVEAADKIELSKDAKLVGDIKTARIAIEDGAYFEGSIAIVRPEVSTPGYRKSNTAAERTPAVPGAIEARLRLSDKV